MMGADWIAVASAEHVAMGRRLGFMQVCHGKGAPLKRLNPGDRIAYYSPVREFGGRDACQAFTALGVVRDERVYQRDMGGGFRPFRRDVDWLDATEAAIHPLAEQLSFMQGKTNWGYAFRFGLLKVSPDDMDVIEHAMQARSLEHA